MTAIPRSDAVIEWLLTLCAKHGGGKASLCFEGKCIMIAVYEERMSGFRA